jgi:hypothetical protein
MLIGGIFEWRENRDRNDDSRERVLRGKEAIVMDGERCERRWIPRLVLPVGVRRLLHARNEQRTARRWAGSRRKRTKHANGVAIGRTRKHARLCVVCLANDIQSLPLPSAVD